MTLNGKPALIMNKINVLGIQIDDLLHAHVLEKVREFLNSGKQHIIATPNPEFVLQAQGDKEFREILNKADLAVPDGFGLILASWFLGRPLKQRITGVDLMQEICKIAAETGKSVFLLGAGEGVGERVAAVLQKQFLKLKVVGAEWGGMIKIANRKPACRHGRPQIANLSMQKTRPNVGDMRSPADFACQDVELLKIIQQAAPDILFVALGHPKQEKWIAAHLKELPSVKLAMGVGGAFDYISGVVPRAPQWMRGCGLEWLFRLIYEPRRIGRIFRAVVVFPWMVFVKKLAAKS